MVGLVNKLLGMGRQRDHEQGDEDGQTSDHDDELAYHGTDGTERALRSSQAAGFALTMKLFFRTLRRS